MPADATPKRRTAPWALAALLVVLLVYLVLALGSARRKSVTVDELGHLPAGVYFLQTGDPRYASLNPPLVNALSALPVFLLRLDPPLEPPPASDEVISFWSTGYQFHEAHRADYVRIFDAARVAPIALVACLAVVSFFWTRRLAPASPDRAGVFAAGLLCLSPNVIAHARLVGTDTGTALFVTLAVLGLWRLLRAPGGATVLACGALLGLAQLTKFYALLLYPTFLVVALVWHAASPPPRPARSRLLVLLALAFGLSLVVLNTGYLWRDVGASLTDLALESPALVASQRSPLGSVPLPLPAAYVRAFDGQLVEVGSTLPSFLFGERFEGGRWYFYLALLAVKTPLGLLAAFALAVALAAGKTRLAARESVLLLAYPATLFVVLSLSSGRQLGARALLSAAPLVWIWAAATVAQAGSRRWPAAVMGAALLATGTASVWTYPNYLSYFNVLAGGPEAGYRYASGANVDIGQDLPGLAAFLESQSVERVQLLYYGSVDPALYGIDYEIPDGPLHPGLFAVSVSLYRTGYPMYDAGQLRIVGPVEPVGLGKPIANIGGSIHVYRVLPRPGP